MTACILSHVEAGTLNCPMCGAPTRTTSPNCGHCGARLATVSCPACFGTVFEGSKYCPACGTQLLRVWNREVPIPCPKCDLNMHHVLIGAIPVAECERCHGLWVENTIFEQICVDQEKQSAVLGLPSRNLQPGQQPFDMKVRYFPCPACRSLMNRVNFAKCSGVIIDICRTHGTWFEKEELHRIITFIREGGLNKTRQKEIADLEEARRRLENARSMYTNIDSTPYRHSSGLGDADLFSMAGSLFGRFFR